MCVCILLNNNNNNNNLFRTINIHTCRGGLYNVSIEYNIHNIGCKKSTVRCSITNAWCSVFCPGFQKGRVPSEKGTFSEVSREQTVKRAQLAR